MMGGGALKHPGKVGEGSSPSGWLGDRVKNGENGEKRGRTRLVGIRGVCSRDSKREEGPKKRMAGRDAVGGLLASA